MNLRLPVALLTAALTVSACNDATAPQACDVVPTRIVETRGDTLVVSSGLKYLELQAGSGATARTCVSVEVAYTGYFTDGEVFDSGSFSFTPGTGEVIPGFEQGVVGMRVGAKRRAFVPYYLGYGERGFGKIPPRADLIFDLELLRVVE